MENAPPNAELREAEERYRTLLEINNAIISNLTQEALFHAVAQALRRVIPFDRTAILLHDPQKDVLRLFTLESSHPSPHFRVGLEIAAGESHVGWVFQHRQPIVRSDLGQQRQYPPEDLLFDEGFRSLVVVPLIARGQAVGTLNMASMTVNQYSAADAVFLQEVANQIALAVENMKSYEQIARLSTLAEEAAGRYRTLLEINNAIITNLTQEALLHAVCEALQRVIPFDRAALTLYVPVRDTLKILALEGDFSSDYFHLGLELDRKDSHPGWAFDHRRPLLRKDLEADRQFSSEHRLFAEGILSMCTAPLLVGGSSIGTLSLASNTRNHYSEATVELLQETANQVALAVENMKSYEEIARLKARLERENVYLREEIRREHNFEEMVGQHPALLELLQQVEAVAATDTTVLIGGETGTGKELIVEAIHSHSARRGRPLVKINCAAIAAGLVESELFGHVKGAFTGALERRVGRFEVADGGTLFLDEVSELSLETQAKLLRVLQEQGFEPVGSNRTIRVNVRILAASNRDLEKAVHARRFREDLFYRLNVLSLTVPPLRQRPTDVPQLAMFFLERYAKKFDRRIEGFAASTMERLMNYSWPGNVRELQNVIERAVVLCPGPILELKQDLLPVLPPRLTPHGSADIVDAGLEAAGANPNPTLPTTGSSSDLLSLDELQRQHILAVLKQTGGVIEGPKGAAGILHLHPNTLRSRMKKLKIERLPHELS